MGSFFASFGKPVLPIPVKASDLENGDKVAIEQFRKDYRSLGVSVLEMDDNFYKITQDYRATCGQWFDSNTFDHKKTFIAESKDALFKELGRRPNIGYILTENKKEYLKFKNSSTVDMFPNQEIYTKFKQLYQIWDDAAMICMECILSEIVPKPKKDTMTATKSKSESKTEEKKDENENEDKESEEKLPENMEFLTTKEDRANIRKFGGIHSSISLIHYFKKLCDKEDEEKVLETEDDKLKNRILEVPLGKHVDTGLMTLITCSDVAGLEVLDRKTNKYFYPENTFDPKKHIFVIAGRKMELFSWKSVIKPTWHAVRIPLETERNSLLYFMEIQKDH